MIFLKRQIYLISFLAIFGFWGAQSESVHASKDAERNIINLLKQHKSLKDLDGILNDYYNKLSTLLSPAEKKKLLEEQRLWIKNRNKNYETIEHLQHLYKQRVGELSTQYDLEEKRQKKGMALFINSKPTIDYHDKELNAFLSSCDLNVCKAYKAFFDYEKSPKNSKEREKAKALLLKVKEERQENAIQQFFYYSNSIEDKQVDDFLSVLSIVDKIPVWLVLKHPEIIGYSDACGWANLEILADKSFHTVPEFQALKETLDDMDNNYFYQETSYSGGLGTNRLTYGRMYAAYVNCLSFDPGYFYRNPKEKDVHPKTLEAWALQGIWNRLTYKKYRIALENAVPAIEKYYNENYNLKEFAPKAAELISFYVHQRFPQDLASESRIFPVVSESTGKLDDIKQRTRDFHVTDWDVFLHMAILADFPEDTIAWALQKGASVNLVYREETPLMNAVTRPDILKLLLKNGADIHAQNTFGKTALFYAVQFGGLESVEILLKAGARVNDEIDSLQMVMNNSRDYLIEKVVDFTPLVYALRYASKEVIQLLINSGANLGKAPEERIQEWAVGNRAITKEFFEETLKISRPKA